MFIPYPHPYSIESLLKPVSQKLVIIPSDEYVEKEDFELYYPVKFDMLSILVNQIEKFHNFSKEQWEYSGYKMPEGVTFDNTIGFLSSIPEAYLFNLNPENIEPTPYGTFVLEFSNNQNLISVEIGKNKLGYFNKLLGQVISSSDGINFDADNLPKEIMDAFEKMLS